MRSPFISNIINRSSEKGSVSNEYSSFLCVVWGYFYFVNNIVLPIFLNSYLMGNCIGTNL